MEVFRDWTLDWEAADAAHMTGDVRIKRLADIGGETPVRIFRVDFEPPGRTFWHAHSGPQLLYVAEGVCRVQKWGERRLEAGPGDIVHIEPEEKHWHGAAPGSRMIHLAININARTTWMEEVSPEQYGEM